MDANFAQDNNFSAHAHSGVLKYLLLISGGVLLICLVIFAFIFIAEPTSLPQNVFISNTTDTQVSVSFTTKKPTRGTILVSHDGKFPILPAFGKITKDDTERDLQKFGFYTTHHFTIGGLESESKYKFKIYQGQHAVYEGEFLTTSASSAPQTPNPVYGRVLTSTGQEPIVGGIVYFQAENESGKSNLLSTITNIDGRWTIDMANLRIDKVIKELVVVEAGELGNGKAESQPGKDKPWPDILISKQ